MHQFDPARLRELHRPRWSAFWLWLGLLAALGLGEGALFWAVATYRWWVVALLLLPLAHPAHGHLIAFHEAAHGNLCPWRPLNDAVGGFIGAFSFVSLSLFRVVHGHHHAYLATPRDEELWPYVDLTASRKLRCTAAAAELFLGLLYTPVLFLRSFLRPGSPIRERKLRRRIWSELGIIVPAWSVALALVGLFHVWWFFFFLYVIPASLAAFLQSARKFIEHVGLHGETVLGATRSVIPPTRFGKWFARSLLNEPYHGVHHLYAKLPERYLPECVEVLVPCQPDETLPFASYREALLGVLHAMRDPRAGAHWRSV